MFMKFFFAIAQKTREKKIESCNNSTTINDDINFQITTSFVVVYGIFLLENKAATTTTTH
jgi:hypothetical protein